MACCSHDHDCEAASCGESSLHGFVNHTGVTCLNAKDADAAPRVLRPWHERRVRSGAPLESDDDDPELILRIPFTTDVKLRGIVVSGGGGGSSPVSMRAWINRDDIDFALAHDLAPVQEWSLVEDPSASIEYTTRLAKFQSVASLTLHFPSNGGGDCTRIHFVGLRGEGSGHVREAPRHIVYEAVARPQDHQVPGQEGQSHTLHGSNRGQ